MLRPIIKNRSAPGTAASSANSAKKNIPFLKQGEVIRGTVLENLNKNEFLISSKGRNFKAYSAVKLDRGSEHNFQVISTGDKTELKVIGLIKNRISSPEGLLAKSKISGSRLTSLINSIIKNSGSVSRSGSRIDLLKNLASLLKFPMKNESDNNTLLWLNRRITGSGIFWENKVLQYLTGKKNMLLSKLMGNDLKGILLALGKELKQKNGEREISGDIIGKVKEAVDLIEHDQMLNLTSIREGIGWFIHLAGFDDEDFNFAELFIKNENRKVSVITLYMDMTYAGKIEAALSMQDGVISININVENMETADIMDKSLPVLKKSLSESGMRVGDINCRLTDRIDPVCFNNDDIHYSVDLVI